MTNITNLQNQKGEGNREHKGLEWDLKEVKNKLDSKGLGDLKFLDWKVTGFEDKWLGDYK